VHGDDFRIGAAVVGLGGAVGSTAVAGVELMKLGMSGTDGLPLATVRGLAPYESLQFGGWDIDGDDLAKAAHLHRVLNPAQIESVATSLEKIIPWPAAADAAFCRRVVGGNVLHAEPLRERVELIQQDICRFRNEHRLDTIIVVNVASTESLPDTGAAALADLSSFERGLDRNDPSITPGMLYAYAAISEQAPYVNFTPSLAIDVPALMEMADVRGVPVAGKDGKTGQTLVKTVLAPAFRSRSLRVEGWYSTNILGNRDGQALDDPQSLRSKLTTKRSVLDSILGYPVDSHIVRIDYYRPRGDEKESWDNVDLRGFLGQRMQLKVDFLCRDSILAAPLVLELIRLLAEAQRRGERGIQEQFGYFFKAPATRDGREPAHALHTQERNLYDWLDAR
jgi:myo-inositol-1-phosphate synthase